MITANDIIKEIEIFAPLGTQESYDNSGLQVGITDICVNSVLITTDITEAVVDEAIATGCEMVVSHHPLLFRGLKHVGCDTYIERVVRKAIKNDIILYSVHTNLDKSPMGVNYHIAKRLGLTNTSPLHQDTNGELGLVGLLEHPTSAITFLEFVKKSFDVEVIKVAGDMSKTITRVAVCGGAGSEFIQLAINKNADIYITADLKYHDFFLSDDKIILADIGHYESEQVIKDILYNLITEKFPKFAVRLAESDCNPVRFL